MIKGEETLQQICSQHEIHASVLQRWKKQFMENGADVFEEGAKSKKGQDSTSEKMGPLERKIGQLTWNWILQKKSWSAQFRGKKGSNRQRESIEHQAAMRGAGDQPRACLLLLQGKG